MNELLQNGTIKLIMIVYNPQLQRASLISSSDITAAPTYAPAEPMLPPAAPHTATAAAAANKPYDDTT